MRPVDGVLSDIEAQSKREYLPILGREQAEFLEWLVREHRPCTSVDVGAMTGYATLRIGRNVQEGCVVSGVEISADLAHRADANVALAGLTSKVRIIRGDATVALEALHGPIDFVLLDAERARYLHHLKRLESKLAPGAIIVANGTGAHARLLGPYLRHVRESGQYESDPRTFAGDAMEVSRFLG